ncbi:MAG: hypothetical protein ACLSCO_16540 [Gallintestinimicrobium sp.]
MLKIPKNVMQIGTGSPNVKLYMEDYVHTFLERCQGKETCLAFGQQEEKDGIRYYLIYGVEKETDFRRGNFPYFQKLERIGKIEKRKLPSGSGPCGEKKSRSEAILFFMNKTKKCRHI